MLVVCLPTYNEQPNLEAMVRALTDVFAESGLDGRILVVDDASPDGTGQVADRLADELGTVDVLHRRRREGLGPAYVAGFRRALAMGADLVLQMDCDFSHDPKDVPRLVTAVADADLALGSRYVPGGRAEDWGLARRAISRFGCAYARLLLGVAVADLTGGFKCYRRRVLEVIDLDAVASRGYAFQVETTYRSLLAGFRVVEIPIAFVDRAGGESKMGGEIVFEAAWRVPSLRIAALRGRIESRDYTRAHG